MPPIASVAGSGVATGASIPGTLSLPPSLNPRNRATKAWSPSPLPGGTEHALLAQLKRDYATVRHVKPQASRADSSELYLLATGFRGG